MSAGLLFSQMEPPAGWQDDFHDWYETEHIPGRTAIPGLAAAARDTPRRATLAERDWFTSARWVYRPIHRAVASPASPTTARSPLGASPTSPAGTHTT
ncbi:MAG TPA: hypothetical protein VGM91_16055 [Conexibacter sp.]|jgi:hypothetical protein